MRETLAVLLLVVGALVPGWLLLQQFRGSTALHLLEQLFAALTFGFLTSGWLAFLLAEIGWFSLGRLAALWSLLVLALLALLVARRERVRLWPTTTQAPVSTRAPFLPFSLSPRWEYALLALWLPIAGWLFLRPHEYILGGADAGVYVNTAAHIAGAGSILVEDGTLAALDPALYPALLRERPAGEGTTTYLFPGFNIDDEGPAGRVIPEFFHLHPVWQAVAYSLGGVEAALLTSGLWALLGSLAIYLLLRQIAGWPVALLALGGLSINAIQVWFARYPVAETLTQYLLWSALWALSAWLVGRRPLPLWGALAGLALGQVFLVRIDTLFLLAIPVLAALWLWLSGRWQRAHLAFFVPLSLLVTHTLAHGTFISGPYFVRIVNYVTLMLSVFWLVPLLLLVAAAMGLLLLIRYRRHAMRLLPYRRPLLAVAATLIVLLAGYGWFIRPVVGATASYTDWYGGQTILLTDRENLLRLGWYLSPLGIWLGALGMALLLWHLRRGTAALLGVGLFFSLLYLWRIQATPHQIYAMRRYVPVTMPFFIIGAAYLLGRMGLQRQRWLRLASLLLALAWLAGLAWSARGFISQVDNQGLVQQVARLDRRLGEDAVLLFNDQAPVSEGDLLGTPLHYLHGHDAYTLRDPTVLDEAALQRQIATWQAAGREVYWVGNPAFLQEHQIPYEEDTFTLTLRYLERVYDRKPTRLTTTDWVLSLARVE